MSTVPDKTTLQRASPASSTVPFLEASFVPPSPKQNTLSALPILPLLTFPSQSLTLPVSLPTITVLSVYLALITHMGWTKSMINKHRFLELLTFFTCSRLEGPFVTFKNKLVILTNPLSALQVNQGK